MEDTAGMTATSVLAVPFPFPLTPNEAAFDDSSMKENVHDAFSYEQHTFDKPYSIDVLYGVGHKVPEKNHFNFHLMSFILIRFLLQEGKPIIHVVHVTAQLQCPLSSILRVNNK